MGAHCRGPRAGAATLGAVSVGQGEVLRQETDAASRGSHVVGYGEDAGVPLLLLADGFGAAPRPVPLEGTFEWRISGTRTCIGKWAGAAHLACPTATPTVDDFVCASCSGLEAPDCVFEPRCINDPASCTCPFGPVPHIVYVAFFGPLAKVGLTQAWRLAARLREQGADAYVAAATCPDRASARLLERRISFRHGIPEFRGAREVLPQLVRPVEWNVIEARAAAVAQHLAPTTGPVGPLVRITDHPVDAPLPGVPRRVATHGEHAGTWLGAKGQNLFYQEARRIRPGASGAPGVSGTSGAAGAGGGTQARLPWTVRGDGTIRPVVAALKRSDLLGRTVFGAV